MKKNRSPILWIVAGLFVPACALIAGSSATGAPSANAPASGTVRSSAEATSEPEDNFPLPPDPVTVHAVLDSGQTFSNKLQSYPGLAMSGQIGGKTAAGIEFTIQFPEGLLALDAEGDQVPAFGTTVTVTPVSAIPDIPFQDGYLAAFHLAPEGLLMAEPASLDMTVPGEYGPDELIGFAADGTGEDFHLFPVNYFSFDGKTMVFFDVMHFSLYGVAKATLQEIEAQHARPPANPDHQDEDELAPLVPVPEDDLAPLVPVTEDTPNQKKLRKSFNRTVKPYLNKLENLDCNKVGVAAYEFQKWYGRTDHAGEVNRFQTLINDSADALLNRLMECVKVNCPLCAGGNKNKKSVDLFMVLTTWGETISRSIGKFEQSLYWRNLGNLCADQAGIPMPRPGIAGGCTGNECDATPTPLKCP